MVARYGQLFAPTVEARLASTPAQVAEWIAGWRARLADLSWFMEKILDSHQLLRC